MWGLLENLANLDKWKFVSLKCHATCFTRPIKAPAMHYTMDLHQSVSIVSLYFSYDVGWMKSSSCMQVSVLQDHPPHCQPHPSALHHQVHGDKDPDGFYRGECGGRLGYVPCNMVSEIQVDDEETRQQLLLQGFLSTAAASMEKIGRFRAANQRSRRRLFETGASFQLRLFDSHVITAYSCASGK